MFHWNQSEKILSRHFSQKQEVKSLFFSLSLRLDFLECSPRHFPMLSVTLAYVHLGHVRLCHPLAAIDLRKIRIFWAFPHHFYEFLKKNLAALVLQTVIKPTRIWNSLYQSCEAKQNMWIWKTLYEKSLTPQKSLTFRSDGSGLWILVSFSNALSYLIYVHIFRYAMIHYL